MTIVYQHTLSTHLLTHPLNTPLNTPSQPALPTHPVTDLIALYDDTYVQFLVCVVSVLLLCEAVYVVFTNRELERLPLPYSKIIRPITYSIVSATVGTQSVLQSKCVAELLRTSVESDDPSDTNILQSGFFYLGATCDGAACILSTNVSL